MLRQTRTNLLAMRARWCHCLVKESSVKPRLCRGIPDGLSKSMIEPSDSSQATLGGGFWPAKTVSEFQDRVHQGLPERCTGDSTWEVTNDVPKAVR